MTCRGVPGRGGAGRGGEAGKGWDVWPMAGDENWGVHCSNCSWGPCAVLPYSLVCRTAVLLVAGINYVPNEYLLDPRYAPPQQYIMSTQVRRGPLYGPYIGLR